MGGSSSSSGDTTKTKRYAPYIESKHTDFLAITAIRRDDIIDDSPFTNYDPVDVDIAFFGLGYIISSFPSLNNMFGKHMAGLDIEEVWTRAFDKLINEHEIDDAVVERMKLADDEMVKGELADFQVDMRNLNAVATSSFVLGKAVVEDKRVKTIAKISLDAKIDFFAIALDEHTSHLSWEKKTVTVYAEIMKSYFMFKPELDDVNTTFDSRDLLWPFTVLSFEGAALGTMQSIVSWRKTASPRKRSTLSTGLSVASYTVSGVMIGSYFGPYGAVIGGVIGFVVGVGMMLLE